MLWNTVNQTVELGWDFYIPVLLFVGLIALAVPVWAAIGSAAILMLLMSGDLPAKPCRRAFVHWHRCFRTDRHSALHPYR